MIVLVELGRTKVEIALFDLLIKEGILEHNALLEVLPRTDESMCDIDAIFKGRLFEELKHLLHVIILDLRYCRFHPPSLN